MYRISKIIFIALFSIVCYSAVAQNQILIECESFEDKGGWVIDQQFMNIMGSPYLMAHGLGKKVDNASTKFNVESAQNYYVYVRTFNWTSPWYNGDGAGKFRVKVNGKKLKTTGYQGSEWQWEPVGSIKAKRGENKIELEDLSGFNGRCDAILFSTTKQDNLPSSLEALANFRDKFLAPSKSIKSAGNYDLVVVGGGVAGISAAISASRLGLNVALINDRPILGGCNSSEIRVHLGGRIELAPYPKLGELQKEFGHTRVGNAQPAENYEDYKKQAIVDGEKNITLFANTRAVGVTTQNSKITSVETENIECGSRLSFKAPLFVDCTGDGTIGYLAGAHYRMGREGKDEFYEELAPEEADKMTMGSSVQWYSKDRGRKSSFPMFKYGIDFNATNFEDIDMGEWTWETGMNYNQISDFERIRDYGLLVIFSNWSYLKNEMAQNDRYINRELEWVAYIAGKRESRRLLGDYILKEQDITRYIVHEDGTASTSWSIDLHYPDPKNSTHFKNNEFKSIAKHKNIFAYPIPYRCLYSRNINNLFMAGRNISVTHVALGTVRVMRTTGMMGEVVGMAAYLCNKHNIEPRGVYYNHIPELKELMQKGVGKKEGMINTQTFNNGGHLKTMPQIK